MTTEDKRQISRRGHPQQWRRPRKNNKIISVIVIKNKNKQIKLICFLVLQVLGFFFPLFVIAVQEGALHDQSRG